MSVNVSAVCASFKAEMLEAIHNLAAAGDSLKVALYYQNQGLGSGTTAYSASGEVSGTGYTAGGKAVSNAVSPAVSGMTAYWTPSASVQWTGLTIGSLFDCFLLYNASKSNRAIAVVTFPAQTISSGTFTITFPTNAPTTAQLQVS
jgi:hypothetical protein